MRRPYAVRVLSIYFRLIFMLLTLITFTDVNFTESAPTTYSERRFWFDNMSIQDRENLTELLGREERPGSTNEQKTTTNNKPTLQHKGHESVSETNNPKDSIKTVVLNYTENTKPTAVQELLRRQQRQIPTAGKNSKHFIPNEGNYPSSFWDNCWLLFSELKLPIPNTCDAHFLELEKTCKSGGSLRAGALKPNWRIGQIDCEAEELEVWINLNRAKLEPGEPKTPKGKLPLFLVIGSRNEHAAQVKFNHPTVQYAGGDENQIFKSFTGNPILLLLLHSDDVHDFSNINLPVDRNPLHSGQQCGRRLKLKLTDTIIASLKKTVKDALVVTPDATKRNCPVLFKIIDKEVWGADREVSVVYNPTEKGRSLNHCMRHSRPYDPYAWMYGWNTPGQTNLCCGTLLNSDSSESEVSTLRTSIHDNQPPTKVPRIERTQCSDVSSETCQGQSCSRGTPTALGSSSSGGPTAGGRNEQLSCSERVSEEVVIEPEPPNPFPEQPANLQGRRCNYNTLNSKVAQHMPHLRNLDNWILDRMPDNPLDKDVDAADLQNVRLHLGDELTDTVVTNPNVKWWFRLVRDDQNNFRISCQICRLFIEEGNRLDRRASRAIKPIMTDQGEALTETRPDNDNLLMTHPQEQVHQDATDYVLECVGQPRIERRIVYDSIRAQYHPQERWWIPSVHLFKMVIKFVKMGVGFDNWPSFADMIEFVDGFIGVFYQSVEGLKAIIRSISSNLKDDLIRQIQLRRPLTLLVDGYQDKTGRHLLGMAFMLYFNGQPQVKFYRLVELTQGLDSRGMMQIIRRCFQQDGIDEDVRVSLIGLATDGASVNQGQHRSLRTEIAAWTERTVHWVWCSGHRVNLVIKQAFTIANVYSQWPTLQRVMQSMKELYKLFGPTTKYRSLLREQTIILELAPCFLVKPYDLRWAHTQRHGLTRVYRLIQPILLMLRTMRDDPSNDAARTLRITNIYELMRSKQYLPSLAFLIDVFGVIDKMSLKSQYHTASKLNNAFIRSEFLRDIRALMVDTDRSQTRLVDFLNEALWGGNDVPIGERLRNYELDREGVEFGGIELRGHETDGPDSLVWLSVVRRNFLNHVIQRINHYYTEEEQQQWQIFSTPFIQAAGDDINYFAERNENHLRNLLTSLDYNEQQRNTLWAEFRTFYPTIRNSATFATVNTLRPQDMWIRLLQANDLQWTANLRTLMDKLLVLPSGVVNLERLFSNTTFTFGNTRLNLHVDTMENLLRIRENTPKYLRNWDVFPFVVNFITNNNARSDDSYDISYARVIARHVNYGVREEQQELDEVVAHDEMGQQMYWEENGIEVFEVPMDIDLLDDDFFGQEFDVV